MNAELLLKRFSIVNMAVRCFDSITNVECFKWIMNLNVIDSQMFVIYHHDVTYSSYGFYGNETL